jgi:DNA repair protein RadD
MFTLRNYQQEAIDALHEHVCTKQTNPCVVLPTGSGKSVVMAAMIKQWQQDAPWLRGCVLAHRKELVVQNAGKLEAMLGESVGVFAAGLDRRDYDAQILFASIDSVYKRSGEFQPFDFLFVDEAHRIPPSGEGKYRTFIKGCKKFNQHLRVAGWTATPHRMGCGAICHRDHILNEVCYEAGITKLIAQGYLCNLRSKVGEATPDLSEVRKNSGGDYIVKSLAEAAGRGSLVSSAVNQAVEIIRREGRKTLVFFCIDIEHCKQVSAELARHGIAAPCLTGKTRKDERDRIINDYKSGRLNAVCNVNVLTEGFDAPHIDCIVLLRPTLSAGLFSQMVGRGLRPHDSKEYCLVLDFAGCIDEHGPIDTLEGPRVVMATCGECRESFSRAVRQCPVCGWVIPKVEMDAMNELERERRMHGDKASKKSILSGEPETYKVDGIKVMRHAKLGKPDSLKVQFRCGLSIFSLWVCLDHEGVAGRKAKDWILKHTGDKKIATVNDALGDMFLVQKLSDCIKTITVRRNGKYNEVVATNQAPGEASCSTENSTENTSTK